MTIDLRGLRKLYLLTPLLLLAMLLLGCWITIPQKVQAAPKTAADTRTRKPLGKLTTAKVVPNKMVVPIAASAILEPAEAVIPAEVAEPNCLVCQPTGLPLVVDLKEPVYVTCRFRDPHQPQHGGLDFPTDKYTEVRATQDGIVSQAEYDPIYGNLVAIANLQWQTRYAHNAYLLVRAGDQVQAGDLIALVGNTGDSSGAHLHYEVRDARDTARDPEKYLKGAQLLFAPCTNEEEE